MSPQSKTDLASALPRNLQYLSALIARKPQKFSTEWAATIDEAFLSYTRTSTIDTFALWNELLARQGWPFPAYLNLREEIKAWPFRFGKWERLRGIIRGLITGKKMLAMSAIYGMETQPIEDEKEIFHLMTYLFWRNSKAIFQFWRRHPLLKNKEPIVDCIQVTYNKRLFAACLPTLLGLLDYVMRDYFQTDRLNVSLQSLRNAFEKAAISPKHLKPGVGVWNFDKETETEILFPTIEQDLRLPGILLSSFLEFGNSYYAWCSSVKSNNNKSILNRHAIIHCATDYWSNSNATKLLTFFDLTLRLESVLKIVIHGPEAYEP